MPKNRILCTIVLALLLPASNAPAQKPKPAAADYFPLRVDDSWTYRNTSDDSRYTLKVLKPPPPVEAQGKTPKATEKREMQPLKVTFEGPADIYVRREFSIPLYEEK